MECHEAWVNLIKGKAPAGDISIVNTTVQGSPGEVSTSDPAYTSLPVANPQPPAPIDPSISKSFFISSAQS